MNKEKFYTQFRKYLAKYSLEVISETDDNILIKVSMQPHL